MWKLNSEYTHECAHACAHTHTHKREMTLVFQRMPLGSLVTSHASRQSGTSHLFDMDPSVRTGTIEVLIQILPLAQMD